MTLFAEFAHSLSQIHTQIKAKFAGGVIYTSAVNA